MQTKTIQSNRYRYWPQTFWGKLWGNRHFHSLLLGIWCDTGTVEGNLAIVSKSHNYLSFDTEIPLLGRYQDLLGWQLRVRGFNGEWRRQTLSINLGPAVNCSHQPPSSKFVFRKGGSWNCGVPVPKTWLEK